MYGMPYKCRGNLATATLPWILENWTFLFAGEKERKISVFLHIKLLNIFPLQENLSITLHMNIFGKVLLPTLCIRVALGICFPKDTVCLMYAALQK